MFLIKVSHSLPRLVVINLQTAKLINGRSPVPSSSHWSKYPGDSDSRRKAVEPSAGPPLMTRVTLARQCLCELPPPASGRPSHTTVTVLPNHIMASLARRALLVILVLSHGTLRLEWVQVIQPGSPAAPGRGPLVTQWQLRRNFNGVTVPAS